MRYFFLLITLVSCLSGRSQEKGQILFFQTDWGRQVSWDVFCQQVKTSGYDGIEVWLPADPKDQKELRSSLKKYNLLVGFLNGTKKSLPFAESVKSYKEQLEKLMLWKPAYINCHTGSDFFTMEQNMAYIDVANKISKENNIPVYHETHRGMFSFNLPDTKEYLKENPDIKLNLDISHWMVVHESLLENQDKNLEEVINNTYHIHARVGHPEGPQVSDPEAPEWHTALERHLDIWEEIIRKRWSENHNPFTVTTEFGPPDYMPTLPYTHLPVADQWKANVFIMNAIKDRMKLKR